MLRAARVGSAPTSPSRPRSARPQPAWTPALGIRFASESTANVQSGTADQLQLAKHGGWQPGDAILFDERGRQSKAGNQAQGKGKGKATASTDLRRSPLVSPSARPSNTSPTHTQATISSSPRFSLLSNSTSNTSTQSWGLLSHRWEPPSPSLSLASADRTSSTMRFSPSRSYARIGSPMAVAGTGELTRPESPFGAQPDEGGSDMLEVEFGSFTAATDEHGNGKVDMGVQVGTPWAHRAKRGEQSPPHAPRSAVQLEGVQLPPVLSQAQVDDLFSGIDFDDDLDLELSLSASEGTDSVASFHSALDSPLSAPLSLRKNSSPSPFSPNVSLRTRHPHHSPPSPLSNSLEADLFSPNPIPPARRAPTPPRRSSSPIATSSFYPSLPSTFTSRVPGTMSARPFSTTALKSDLSREEMMEALETEEGMSSEIEFLSPPPRKSGAKGKEKERDELVLSEDDNSEELEILPLPPNRVRPPPSSTTAVAGSRAPPSSGWFTKPSSSSTSSTVASKSSTSTTSASRTNPPPPSRPSRPRAPPKEGTLAHKRSLAATRKAEANASLRAEYPRDFRWERWGVKRAQLVFSRDEAEVERIVEGMKGPLGFDLEWEPSTRRGVENKTAVVQLCDEETILIVHLAKMKRFPPGLRAILENPEVIKLGVQIGGDARKITRDYPGFAPRGLLELNNVAKTVDPDRFKGKTGLVGLQKLVGVYLDHYLSKDGGVRMGKWGDELGEEQVYYAANDVFSSLHVFLVLQSLAGEREGSTSYLYHVSSNVSTASSFRPPRTLQPSGVHNLPPHNAPIATASNSSDSPAKRLSPTPRQMEAYTLFHLSSLSVDEVALHMDIKPLSVVWGLLNCLATVEGGELEVDERRLLEAVEEVGGVLVHKRMAEEGAEVLERCRKRLRMRGEVV